MARLTGTNDLLLHFGDQSSGIILTNQWSSSAAAVEQVHFVAEDGMDAGDIASLYLQSLATAGADTISGNWAAEHMIGLDGNDSLSGGDGNDTLDGGNGDDSLNGGDGSDHLNGDAGNDSLNGGTNGSDVLNGGLGNDSLTAGRGGVTFVYESGGGDDVLYDDTLYSDGEAPDTLQFGAGIDPEDILFSKGAATSHMVISFADQPGSIRVNNQWWVDSGVESIKFADGTVWSQAEFAARYVSAQESLGADSIWGTNLTDTIEGSDGNDSIFGGTYGNDILIGGSGDDNLSAGRGRITVVYNLGDGADVFEDDTLYDDGEAPDTLLFGAGISPNDIVFSRGSATSHMVVGFAGHAGSIVFHNQWWADAGIESMIFADGTVWSQAQFAARYVAAQASSGADSITGTNLTDTLDGGDGNDYIFGGTYGNDVLIGGKGNDDLNGGRGRITLIYNLGDGSDFFDDDTLYDDGHAPDTLLFGAGSDLDDVLFSRHTGDSRDLRVTFKDADGAILINNQTWADSGIETFRFADGTTLTQAQANALIIPATNGNNTLTGTIAANSIWALEGNDNLSGLEGDDQLYGQAGDDILSGGDGSDVLDGGLGYDLLTGAAGADIFRFRDGDTGIALAADRVVDFVSGVDVLDLAEMDADTATAGNQAFTFIGSDAFSGTAGELRFYGNGPDVVIEADVDGNSTADFGIVLAGTPLPLASDFVL